MGVIFAKLVIISIIDFTSLTNDEIIKLLSQQKGKICGKFYEDQLIIDEQTKKGSSFSKIILASVIATIKTLTSTAQTASKETVKTEQFPSGNNLEQLDTIKSILKAAVATDELSTNTIHIKKSFPEQIQYKPKKKYYFSWKFPFIHKKREVTIRGQIRML